MNGSTRVAAREKERRLREKRRRARRQKAIRFCLKWLSAVALACLLAWGFLAVYFSDEVTEEVGPQYPDPVATITMKSGGTITATLSPSEAPNTVGNFIYLANKGFYDGLDFNYIIPGAFARTGDKAGDGTGNAGYTIAGEFKGNGFSNSLKIQRGTLAMALIDGDPNSASSQFFIMQGTYPEWNGEYAAFGQVTDEGSLSLLDDICSSQTDKYGTPIKRWVIESIRVDTFGAEYGFEKYVDPDIATQKPDR